MKNIYEKGDFVSLIDVKRSDIDKIYRDLNIFEISTIKGDKLKLNGVSEYVVIDEVKPISIDGNSDRYIYYNPTLFLDYHIPTRPVSDMQTDYSYYMDSFKRCLDADNNSLFDLVADKQFSYVHELQQFLREELKCCKLKINVLQLTN